jgi:methylase of polypeptide subunit release factors
VAQAKALPNPPLADPRPAASLVAAFRRVGFDAAALASVLAGGKEEPALFEARTARLPPALATVMRLFVLGGTVPRPVVETALGDGLAAAVGLRMLVEDDGFLQATMRVVPYDVLFVASDLPSPDPPDEHVAAAHLPSLTLARLTVRRRVRRALDLGTGNGIQALLLAQHSDLVVATDLNERALRFTELNAALNGRTNIETRAGSWLEPVAGDRFGVVVSSPPYVVSAGSGLLYRDGDARGDLLSERLVADIPAHLDDGAHATVLVSWVPTEEQAAPAPLRWTSGTGCDALVLTLHRESAEAAAAAWHEGAELAAALDFYRGEGIEEIAYGAVVLRRRARGQWQEAIELPGGPAGHASDHLQRIFSGREWLAAGGMEEHSLVLAPDAVLRGTELSLGGGLGLRAQLDSAGAAVVAQLATARPAGAALAAAARALGDDPERMRAQGEGLVRRLVELGFAIPAR